MDPNSRKQLSAIVGISSLLSVVFSGLDVAFTVYSVNRLGLSASELAVLRSLRLILSIPFILVMGGISDLWGQKKTVFAAVVLTAAASATTILIPGKGTMFATYPIYGGLTAILLVSMNVIPQGVEARLRNLANTLYRSTFVGFSIAGPFLAGILIQYGFTAAFLGFAAVLAISLAAVLMIPEKRKSAQDKEPLGRSLVRTAGNWKLLVRNKPLFSYMVLTGLLNHTVMVNLVLIPVKLMDRLGLSSQHFSSVITLASAAGLLFTIAAGFLMKNHLGRLIAIPMLLSSACNLLLGLETDVPWIIVLFTLSSAFYTVTMAPSSVFLSGMAEGNFGTVFGLFKIVSACLGFVVSTTLSLVQPLLGIDLSLIVYGVIGIAGSLLLMSRLSAWKSLRQGESPSIPATQEV